MGSVVGTLPQDLSVSPLVSCGVSPSCPSSLRITGMLDRKGTLARHWSWYVHTKPNLISQIFEALTKHLSRLPISRLPTRNDDLHRESLGGGRPHVDTHVSLVSPHLLSLQTTTRHLCEQVPPQRSQHVRAREALGQHPPSRDPYTRKRERSSYWASPLRATRPLPISMAK